MISFLVTLEKSSVGCFIGEWFLGALGYADDIVLLAPSANAMRNMIAICDVFAKEYHVTFNCDKTKCITFTRPVESKAVRLVFDGKSIENVDEWSNLGHLININCSDNNDIQARTNCLIGY